MVTWYSLWLLGAYGLLLNAALLGLELIALLLSIYLRAIR